MIKYALAETYHNKKYYNKKKYIEIRKFAENYYLGYYYIT